MRRLLAALAASAAILSAAACSSEEPEKEPEGTAAAAEETSEAEPEETEADEPAEAAGGCGDERVTAAMADIIAAAGVEFAANESTDDPVNCTWNTDSDLGAIVVASVAPSTGNSMMSEDVLESLGQEIIQDSRFEGIGAIPTIVLGCEEDTAASILGCAVAVYGQEADITVQVLMAPDVTKEQIVEAAWALSDAFAG